MKKILIPVALLITGCDGLPNDHKPVTLGIQAIFDLSKQIAMTLCILFVLGFAVFVVLGNIYEFDRVAKWFTRFLVVIVGSLLLIGLFCGLIDIWR